jgi:hypothetical protein
MSFSSFSLPRSSLNSRSSDGSLITSPLLFLGAPSSPTGFISTASLLGDPL